MVMFRFPSSGLRFWGMAWATSDGAVANGEESSVQGNITWTTNVDTRKAVQMTPVVMDQFLIDIFANANTVDGAQIASRVSDTSFVFGAGNLLIIIDQAVAVIEDITNKDSVQRGQAVSMAYTEGDSTVNLRAMALRCSS